MIAVLIYGILCIYTNSIFLIKYLSSRFACYYIMIAVSIYGILVLDKDLVVDINVIVVLNKNLVEILESPKLYGESTVSFTLCLSGGTPVSSPYTMYLVLS